MRRTAAITSDQLDSLLDLQSTADGLAFRLAVVRSKQTAILKRTSFPGLIADSMEAFLENCHRVVTASRWDMLPPLIADTLGVFISLSLVVLLQIRLMGCSLAVARDRHLLKVLAYIGPMPRTFPTP
ncbi:MAG: hypothetical protein ABSG25_07695 [Bryobacteraceae bacterium]